MSIVFACAASHAPGISAWTQAAPEPQRNALFAGFDAMREALAAAKPDRLVVLTSEHWANFFLDHVGAFCIGRADHYEGPVEPWLKIAKTRIPGDPDLSLRMLEHCYAHGFEPSYSHEMRLDHGTMVPLNLLSPGMEVPIVPIMFNTLATPRPSARRCLELGAVLRPVLETSSERIAVIATGGLSHDPAEVGHGFIDTEFDARFIARMNSGDLDALGAYGDDELLKAGAGTLELLAWICLAGVMGGAQSRLVCYEPVKPWATGMGIVAYA